MAANALSHPVPDAVAQRARRALILAAFLSNVAFSFVFPLLPLYVKELLGGEGDSSAALWAGAALAATSFGGAVASPLWGRLADRVGHRPMLLRALACTTVTIALMSLPNAPWQLVVLRALTGALGSFLPAAMAALASWTPREDLSRAVTRLQMASVGGAMVGPLIGGTVAALVSVRASFVAGALVLAVGTILVARWFQESPHRRSAAARGREEPLRPSLLWLPMLTLVAVQFTDGSFNPIVPLLLAQGGDSPGTIAALAGLTASASASAAAGGAAIAGGIFRRGARKYVMMASLAGLALLTVAAVRAPVPWGLMALRVACGGTVGAMVVATFSLGGMLSKPNQQGSAYGWLSSASMGGFAASPVVAGLLAPLDLRAVLVVDTALCLVSMLGWMQSGKVMATFSSRGSRTTVEVGKEPAVAGGVSATILKGEERKNG